jgi:hypothetical protein
MVRWFAMKRYGWGWTPCTWQGWLILCVSLAIFVVWILPLDATSWQFWTAVVVWSVALIGICALTGEKPRWRWG